MPDAECHVFEQPGIASVEAFHQSRQISFVPRRPATNVVPARSRVPMRSLPSEALPTCSEAGRVLLWAFVMLLS